MAGTTIQFKIDENGELEIKVQGVAKNAHTAVDGLLKELAEVMGGERKTHEQLRACTLTQLQTQTAAQ